MRSTLLFFVIFVLLTLGACSASQIATFTIGMATLTHPRPTLVGGVSNMPSGKYLFVEYWHVDDANSPAHECTGAIMFDFPNYYFENGKLRVGQGNWNKDLATVNGFYGISQSATGEAGGGTYSFLNIIKRFPYSPPWSAPMIDSVDAQGSVVVEIEGRAVTLAAGQSWTNRVENDATPGCHRTSTSGFTNYGLLDKSQIVPN